MYENQSRSHLGSYEFNETILQAEYQLLNNYIERHSKTLPVRFDVRYPSNHEPQSDNYDISRCMAKVVQKYKRQGLDPYYIWVREQKSSDNPHFHCLLLLNGHKVQSYHHVFDTVEQLWGSTIDQPAAGLVDHCTKGKYGPHRNGIKLRRCDDDYEERLKDVKRQVSYLAKVQDKGEPKDGLRDFGMSRLK